jgi:thioredoxin reductase (NADPH)
MPKIAARTRQAFPVLDQAQIVTAQGFAVSDERRFAPAEVIYRVGDKNVTVWLVLEGEIELSRHDGLGPDAPISSVASGQFTGEVGQLSGGPALANAQAGPHGCVALPLMPPISARWS